MKSAVLLSSLAFVGAEDFVQGGNLNLKWSDCGDASTKGKVTGLTPSSITLGTKTTATGSGTSSVGITAGTFEIDLKASIISQTFKGDICAPKTFNLPLGTGSLTWDGLKCPVAAGAVSIPVDIGLSASIPTSLQSVTMAIKGASATGDKLLCMEIDTSPALTVPTPNYVMKWNIFKNDFSKTYEKEEEEMKRFEIFKTNVDKIYEENAKEWHSHQLGVNQFADLSKEEFSSMYLGYKPELKKTSLATVPWVSPNITAPASIDWVAKGAVTPVKNQGQCGSCWAFSTTGSTEGAMFVASGKLVSLSEEDLVQCDHNGDQGCQGGLMDNAFKWIQSNGGIASESTYPYTSGSGTTGKCTTGKKSVVTISGHTDVPSKNEDALKLAVAKQPVSVAIEADKSAFQLYKGGVLDSTRCGTKLDHGVLVVGYGTDGGKDYWKVKNSWGASWGEKGYIRMVRGKNQCGIAMQPSYPTGAKAGATVDAEFGCSGSGDPVAGTCYEGSAGALGVKETVKVNLKKYTSGAGTLDLTGTGIKGFTCSDHSFTKSSQDVSVDLSDCLPDGVTVPKLKYCSTSDTIAVTVKDKAVPIPISTTLKKVACSSTIVV